MNRRIYKKKCKQAMRALIARHGYEPGDFTTARMGRDEYSFDPPPGMRFKRGDPVYQDRKGKVHWFYVMDGTPVCWDEPGYYTGESDYHSPVDVLEDIAFWDSLSEQDLWRMSAHLDLVYRFNSITRPRAERRRND